MACSTRAMSTSFLPDVPRPRAVSTSLSSATCDRSGVTSNLGKGRRQPGGRKRAVRAGLWVGELVAKHTRGGCCM
eukprot:2667703-Prymnesium_polylepis.1